MLQFHNKMLLRYGTTVMILFDKSASVIVYTFIDVYIILAVIYLSALVYWPLKRSQKPKSTSLPLEPGLSESAGLRL